MKKASGTHKSMGSKGGVGDNLASGVAETMAIKKGESSPADVGDTGRVKAEKNGSIAAK